ncbi:hypothetical protein JCM33374_g241 [Metschnikowia sp. JCM 33374]|nr:hypothetical protein JCM33374_g241 [Metschnikowia sp. JCM 33374]
MHDPRLQGEVPQGHNESVIQPSQMHGHPQLSQGTQPLSGGIQMQRTSLSSGTQSPSIGIDGNPKLGGQTLTIISKMVAATDEDGSKKKRGRPKKLILDPTTNQYIDSSHENFKKLNKLLKQSTDVTVKQAQSPMENGLKFDALNDQEMKQLLDSKDRRGRPRKFPVEQTGITIKGVRVSGTMKGKRKASPVSLDASDKIQKKRRGRPKREVGAVV